MKKFTFLFIAAVMAVSANAAPFGSCTIGEYGYYDLETGTWIDAVPAANQLVTIAIRVTDVAALTWLAESPYNTLALQDFRLAPGGTAVDESKKSFRLERQGTSNVYAINIVLKQLWADFDLIQAPNVEDGIINCHSGLGKAWGGGDGTDPSWGYEAFGYCHIGFAPASGSDYPNQISCGYEAGTEFEVPGIALPSADCVPAGIEDVFANPQQIERVEFFNLQGMKLQAEPQEGLFIAVPYYKGGVRGEARKVLNAK